MSKMLLQKKNKTIKSENVNVVFEGEPVVAKRGVVKIAVDMFKFLTGGSNIPIVYYVVQKKLGVFM